MKLTTRYNRHIYPAILLLFLLSIISSYFLIRRVLQNELDGIILRTKSRIEEYTKANKAIPQISSFNDQLISFEKIKTPSDKEKLITTTQYIPEQNKNHISRELIFDLPVSNEFYRVTINQPLEGTKHLTILIAKIAISTIFIIIAVLVIINKSVLSGTWKPFYQSLQKIRSFRVNGEENIRFPETRIEEFRLMNDHFALAAQNARLDYRNLKEFSENASHEMQTPLAIIRSNLDILIQQDNLTEKQSELIQSAYSAVSKMSKMQKALLLLTKIDNRQFDRNTITNLDKKVQDKITEFNELWHSKGIDYSTDIRPSRINVNNDLLEILLNNLFSNATKHNNKGGQVSIAVTPNRFLINNTGEDQPLDKERIFRRFYKGSVKNENNGLGLSIIKEICNASGIGITYNFDNGWHQFILTWDETRKQDANINSRISSDFTGRFAAV